jgi:hypothetical protein
MGAHVSISELFGVLLPLDCPDGLLAMITGYFDDSGTHEQSEIVLVAGLFGTEARLESLDRNWRQHIRNPLGGRKPPLRRFHAFDCNASQGEFAGWSRTETDYFCHQLRSTIIEADVAAYGVAIARKDWDELGTGDARTVLGSAEGHCIRNCFVSALGWAQTNTFDPKMTFVFDTRPSPIKRDAAIIANAFERCVMQPKPVGVAFLNSYDIAPLQAADLLAWELYQHANDILRDGMVLPRRKEMDHLTKNMLFHAQIARREVIEKIVKLWTSQGPDKLKEIANHFTYFDPESPEYSHLYGK